MQKLTCDRLAVDRLGKRRVIDPMVPSLIVPQLLSVIYMLMCPLGLSLGLGVHQWNVTRAAYSVFLEVSSNRIENGGLGL